MPRDGLAAGIMAVDCSLDPQWGDTFLGSSSAALAQLYRDEESRGYAHPSERLMAEAKAMAGSIARMSPEGIRLTLAFLDKTADMSRDQSLRGAEILPQWFNMRGSFEDRARSFLDKRSSGDA